MDCIDYRVSYKINNVRKGEGRGVYERAVVLLAILPYINVIFIACYIYFLEMCNMFKGMLSFSQELRVYCTSHLYPLPPPNPTTFPPSQPCLITTLKGLAQSPTTSPNNFPSIPPSQPCLIHHAEGGQLHSKSLVVPRAPLDNEKLEWD